MTAKRISLALLALTLCWCASARAADPWCSAAGQPLLRFTWTPASESDAQHGRVHIQEAASGKTVQVIDAVENYFGNDDGLRVADFNHDRCPDLAIISSVAAIGNESSAVYVYDPASRTFVLHAALSEIGGLALDARDSNCVTGSWKGGADDFFATRSCWVKGRLVLQSESSVSPLLDSEGRLQCYQRTETTYRAGRKQTRQRCTKHI